MSDNVNKPSHYAFSEIECIDYLKAIVPLRSFIDHCRMSAIAYITRSPHKGSEVEDIDKAINYLQRARNEAEKAIRAAEIEKPSKPQELAIPDGWRELNQGESLSIHDLFDFEGEWTACKYDPIGDRYNSRIHKRHIRKIEADKPEHVEGVWVEEADANAKKIEPAEWTPKVGDKVRVNRLGRLSDGKIGVIVEGDAGEYTVRILGHNLTSRNLTADDLELIEAAS